MSPASRNPEILEKSNFPKISGFPPQAGVENRECLNALMC